MGLLLCSLQVEANPQNLLAGAGLVGAGLLAFHNVNKGNGDVSVNPTLGLNYNHKTGSFAPTLGANVQVTRNALSRQTVCILCSDEILVQKQNIAPAL